MLWWVAKDKCNPIQKQVKRRYNYIYGLVTSMSCGLLTTNTLAIRFIQVKSIDKILRRLTLEKLFLLSPSLFWINNNVPWGISKHFLSNPCWSWEFPLLIHRIFPEFYKFALLKSWPSFSWFFLALLAHISSPACINHSMLLNEAVNSIEWYLTQFCQREHI
jgi:hypothetical protein